MAAFFTDRLLSPRAVSAATAFLPTPRAMHPGPMAGFAMVMTILRALGEWVLFLWMVTAIAFFALMATVPRAYWADE
jgi:hypothetical protein